MQKIHYIDITTAAITGRWMIAAVHCQTFQIINKKNKTSKPVKV